MGSNTATREGWTRVRFGDVVRLSTERCTDPVSAGIDRYVGLEHLEPGDLCIRAWGNVADGVTFTNRFRPGQVLFGKRRAYQRKVAVAQFDGICSSDIYVFEPADDRLMPELLPFICQTDGFFDHALKTSAGSLSPRTNWSSLGDYEFDLPPIDEQRRTIECLNAIRSTKQAYSELLAACRALYESAVERSVAPYLEERVPLGTIAHRITNGFVGTAAKHYVADGIPYIRSLNVRRSGIDTKDMVFISSEFHNQCEKSKLCTGDLLTVQSGHVGETAVVPDECDGWNCHAVIITRLDKAKAEPGFIAAYLNSAIGRAQLQTYFVGSTVAHLNTSDLAKLHVPVPCLATQKKILRTLQDTASLADSAAQRTRGCAALYARALQAIVSGNR